MVTEGYLPSPPSLAPPCQNPVSAPSPRGVTESSVLAEEVQASFLSGKLTFLYKTLKFTSHLSEWLLSKDEVTGVGVAAEKREPSLTVGGIVNSCSHCGGERAESSKN